MAVLFANNAQTTLSAGITNVQTAITVTDGSVFPALSGGNTFYMTLDDGVNIEIVEVTARTGNNLTVVRGQESTNPESFSGGTSAEIRVTAGSLVAALQKDLTLNMHVRAVRDDISMAADTDITGKIYIPYNCTLTGVRAEVDVAGSGGVTTMDVNLNGTSVFSTLLTIDTGETSSSTALNPPVISTSSVSQWDYVTIDVDSVPGTPPKGLVIIMSFLVTV